MQIFNKRLIDVVIWFVLYFTIKCLGAVWSILQHISQHMGGAPEGASVCLNLQAIFDCHRRGFQRHIPR